MAIEVRKKEKESVQSLLRRFSRRIQQSGVLLKVRRSRFYASPLTKRQKRISALRKIEIQKEREKLYKLGKLDREFKR
ncbi:30S ribosomal protein S21 [Candidatus Azambacteria bacterium]|nr:30S ribosomal protein S21 [Candidatus Azambacteria bacterium]